MSFLTLFLELHFSLSFSPTGLVPEVPLLQAFENEVGRGWTRLIIAALTIICLCFTLLELSLPLHRRVSYMYVLRSTTSGTLYLYCNIFSSSRQKTI